MGRRKMLSECHRSEVRSKSACFEISSEPESVRNLGGHERIHRTRERGIGYHRGYFRQPSQPTSLYIDPSSPPMALGFPLAQFAATPSFLHKILPLAPQIPKTLAQADLTVG